MQNLTILAYTVPETSKITGDPKIYVTLTTPLLRFICHQYVGLDIAYLCAKFDHYSSIASAVPEIWLVTTKIRTLSLPTTNVENVVV